MAVHEFPDAIYKPRILFITTPRDWATQLEWYGHPGVPYPRAHVAMCTRIKVKRCSSVIIVTANCAALRRRGMPAVVETCAHEATHVMRYVCENVGEDFLGWEAEAHLVGAVAKWLAKIIIDGRVS